MKKTNKITLALSSVLLAASLAGCSSSGDGVVRTYKDGKEEMVLVDTMPAKSFEKSHVPSAVNAVLPVKVEDVKPEEKAAFLKALGDNKDKKIVVYCGFVGCERSHVGAVLAKEAGFKNVYRFPGGIAAWVDAGNSVEK